MKRFLFLITLTLAFIPLSMWAAEPRAGTDDYLRQGRGMGDQELSVDVQTEERADFEMTQGVGRLTDPTGDVLTRVGTTSTLQTPWGDIVSVIVEKNNETQRWNVTIELAEKIPSDPPILGQLFFYVDRDGDATNNEKLGVRGLMDAEYTVTYNPNTRVWETDYRWYNQQEDFWAYPGTAATHQFVNNALVLSIPFEEIKVDAFPNWRAVMGAADSTSTQIDVAPGEGFPPPRGQESATEAAKKAYAPARRFRPLRCHLKLDTGMGRIGVSWPAGLRVAERLRDERGVELEGVYTHLACADADPVFTRLQLERFREALKGLSQAGVRIPLAHAANSAAALLHPASRFDLVRPGLLAYGLFGEGFEPVLSLKTRVVFLKNVRAGTPLSYGALYRTRRPSRIATLPIGYADGLPRLLSIPRQGRPGAAALVRGRRCPIVGAVSMDMTLLDVTGVPDVRVGEEAVLIGRSGSEEVTASELAGWARTIPYEVVTGLKARVPRVYLR